jgi:hypothetical protein
LNDYTKDIIEEVDIIKEITEDPVETLPGEPASLTITYGIALLLSAIFIGLALAL